MPSDVDAQSRPDAQPDEEQPIEPKPRKAESVAAPVLETPPPPPVDPRDPFGVRTVEPSQCGSKHDVTYPRYFKWVRHKLVGGETLGMVAHRYGVTEPDLRAWNGISPEIEKLKRGLRLRVKARRILPPRKKVEYVVKQGDTWARVAVHHGVDPSQLRGYNWPYRKKMRPGTPLKVWIDPIVHDWIQTGSGGDVRRGATGSGPPDNGRLIAGVQIPPGDGYHRRFPDSAFGTSHAVAELLDGLEKFRARSGFKGEILLGSMSRLRGGQLGTHRSHQTGRDIDIRLPRRDGVPPGVNLRSSRVDWNALWDLVQAFGDTKAAVVFLEYRMQKKLYKAAKAEGASAADLRRLLQFPRGPAARRGFVRHVAGHDKHVHVRFGCGPCETECIEKPEGASEHP